MAAISTPPVLANVAKNCKDSPLERRCDNADCNVSKLVAMVPKRKTAQFVTEPSIVEKPMLVNGFTTIFQVDGLAAKISDIRQKANGEAKIIYRIIPNTHAHIANYVVVDAEGESMRKINSGEPATMKKLLDSQRISAEQMLTKLMTGQGSYMQVSNTQSSNGVTKVTMQRTNGGANGLIATPISNTSPISTAVGALAAMPSTTTAKLPMRSVTIKKVATPAAATSPLPTVAVTNSTTNSTNSTSNPHLMRLNSSIKVRSILTKSGEVLSTIANPTSTSTVTTTRTSAPFIKTVPLSQLQQPKTSILNKSDVLTATTKPSAVKVSVKPTATTTTEAETTNNKIPTDNIMFEKMQQELEELRRTVAFLAETQKKTLSQKPTDEKIDSPPEKKARLQ